MTLRAILSLLLALPIVAIGAARADDPFHRGDTNADGAYDLTDGVFVLNWLFAAGPLPPCLDAADTNDSGRVDLTDGVYILVFLFRGGPEPPPPYLDCDADPTSDGLDCADYPELPECAPVSDREFEELVASYGLLETIAGTGLVSDVGVNNWRPEFEGAPAVEVELSRPHDTRSDAAGNYYIADRDGHAIRKLWPDGTITTVAGVNEPGDDGDSPGPGTERHLSSPNGIHVLPGGTVDIVDRDNGKIRRLSPDGTLSTLFAVPGGIPVGRGIWANEAGDLAYVSAGDRVLRWTPDSGIETLADGFVQLGVLVVDPQGRVVVTDRGAHRVWRLDEDGEREAIAGNGFPGRGVSGQPALETPLEEVRAIVFRPDGSFLVGLHEASQVWFVDTRGVAYLFVDGFEDAHSGDGERFDTPGFKISEVRSLDLDPAGNLLIMEHDAGYLRRVRRAAP